MASPSGYEPLLPQAPTPVVVVSPQFCAPDVVPLTVTKKDASLSGGDFTVTDPNGAVVLQFKGSVWSVRNRRVLLDAAGQPILSMHEKLITAPLLPLPDP
ncbi:protein LURP-one-related 15-like isoform X1 [Panicum hallii]|uniref:protein LURP-one-related 15-like isoform X1 n=1 Tax=Panicum hallii TaxID=206008 RepID=UPI000DF4D5C7|nr:protein LURP-one-related 15-like isoform X1 [Panicum hallii]